MSERLYSRIRPSDDQGNARVITVCMHIQFAVAITLLHGNNFLCNTER